jgi:hypothetical protein
MKFMRISVLALLVAAVTVGATSTSFAGAKFGGGLHYLRNLADIKDDGNVQGFDKNSYSILGSVMFAGPLISLEGQAEYIFNFYGSDEAAWAPQVYALIGGMIYGGVGMGWYHTKSEWSDAFYNLRAGVNVGLAGLNLDVYGTYQFFSDDELKDLTGEDFNAVTFAAILRFGM